MSFPPRSPRKYPSLGKGAPLHLGFKAKKKIRGAFSKRKFPRFLEVRNNGLPLRGESLKAGKK